MDNAEYTPESIKKIPDLPGVYFYHDHNGQVIYVGKAKSLKSRVAQYFHNKTTNRRLLQLISLITIIKIIITKNETDALILEDKMIKKYKPKFNILLKDDKTYPYLCLTDHPYPRLVITRNRKQKNCRYFGPYTNGRYVRRVLDMMQKLFKLRTCANSYFNNRSRPCLLYQIQRCSGPCVKKITTGDYADTVKSAIDLLSGRGQAVVDHFVEQMHHHSETMYYEKAAEYRDLIQTIQAFLNDSAPAQSEHSLDIICYATLSDGFLIQVTIYKKSLVESQRDYFFPDANGFSNDLMTQFLYQYYREQKQARPLPRIIILDALDNAHDQCWDVTLKQLEIHARLKLKPTTASERSFLQDAQTNLQVAIERYSSQAKFYLPAFDQLATAFQDSDWTTIDCVDISHIQGKHTTAACVRFGVSGPEKSSYRSYNLETGNDDYASMRAFIQKRFAKKSSLAMPNLLLIDGGRGQLSSVVQSLQSIDMPPIHLLAICKAPGRRSGEEKYYALSLDHGVKTMHFTDEVSRMLENIRDHAHRFAITRQRKKHMKSSLESSFASIPGLGPKRIKQLMHYFGGLDAIRKASVKQLHQVPGISHELAERIHRLVHKN